MLAGTRCVVLDANAPLIRGVIITPESSALLRGVFCAAALCDACVVDAAVRERELCCACQCSNAHTDGGFGAHGGPSLDSDSIVAALQATPIDVLSSTAAWLRGYTSAAKRDPGASLAAASPLLYALRTALSVTAFAASVCSAETVGIADLERSIADATSFLRNYYLAHAQEFPEFFDDAKQLEVQVAAHLVLRLGLGDEEENDIAAPRPARPASGVLVQSDEYAECLDVVLDDGRSVRGLCTHRVQPHEDAAALSPRRRRRQQQQQQQQQQSDRGGAGGARRFGAASQRAGERVGARVLVRAAFLRRKTIVHAAALSVSSPTAREDRGSVARYLAAHGVRDELKLRQMLADRSRRREAYWHELLLLYGDVGGQYTAEGQCVRRLWAPPPSYWSSVEAAERFFAANAATASSGATTEWLAGKVAAVHHAAVEDGSDTRVALACDVALDLGGLDRRVPLKDVRPWRSNADRRATADERAAIAAAAATPLRPATITRSTTASKHSDRSEHVPRSTRRREEELDAMLRGGGRRGRRNAGTVYIDARRMVITAILDAASKQSRGRRGKCVTTKGARRAPPAVWEAQQQRAAATIPSSSPRSPSGRGLATVVRERFELTLRSHDDNWAKCLAGKILAEQVQPSPGAGAGGAEAERHPSGERKFDIELVHTPELDAAVRAHLGDAINFERGRFPWRQRRESERLVLRSVHASALRFVRDDATLRPASKSDDEGDEGERSVRSARFDARSVSSHTTSSTRGGSSNSNDAVARIREGTEVRARFRRTGAWRRATVSRIYRGAARQSALPRKRGHAVRAFIDATGCLQSVAPTANACVDLDFGDNGEAYRDYLVPLSGLRLPERLGAAELRDEATAAIARGATVGRSDAARASGGGITAIRIVRSNALKCDRFREEQGAPSIAAIVGLADGRIICARGSAVELWRAVAPTVAMTASGLRAPAASKTSTASSAAAATREMFLTSFERATSFIPRRDSDVGTIRCIVEGPRGEGRRPTLLALGGSDGGVAVLTVDDIGRDRRENAIRSAQTPRDSHSDAVRAITWLPKIHARRDRDRRSGSSSSSRRNGEEDVHLFATGCQDGSVRVWRVSTARRDVTVDCICALRDADAELLEQKPVVALAACALPLSLSTRAEEGHSKLGVLALGDTSGAVTLWCSESFSPKGWQRTRVVQAHRGAIVSIVALSSSSAATSATFGSPCDDYPFAAFITCGRGGAAGAQGTTVAAWRCEVRAAAISPRQDRTKLRTERHANSASSSSSSSRTKRASDGSDAATRSQLQFTSAGAWYSEITAQSLACFELESSDEGEGRRKSSMGVCVALAGYSTQQGAQVSLLHASRGGDDDEVVQWKQFAQSHAHSPSLHLALSSVSALCPPRMNVARDRPRSERARETKRRGGRHGGRFVLCDRAAFISGGLDGSMRVTVVGTLEKGKGSAADGASSKSDD